MSLGERAKFYRNKQIDSTYVAKIDQDYVNAAKLHEQGISPEEVSILQKLTAASLNFIPLYEQK